MKSLTTTSFSVDIHRKARVQVPPMKILFLIEDLTKGGKEGRLVQLIKGLIHNGDFEPEVAMMTEGNDYEELRDWGLPIHVLKRKRKYDFFMFFRFFSLLKESKPAVVHSWSAMTTIYAKPAARLLGIKLISGSITNSPGKLKFFYPGRFWNSLSFMFADIILSNSLSGIKVYQPPKSKTLCIYNGFDFNRIYELEHPAAARSKWQIPSGKIVGMVGLFYERKDYKSFIQAAILLLNRGREISFLAVGDGPLRAECEAMIPFKYKDKIIFTGMIQAPISIIQIFDIGTLFTNADVHGEGISNAIMEYMALGKPVVATNGGGTPEILLDRKTGFLVPPFASEEIAEKIEYLLDHPSEALKMGEEGRKRIETHFSLTAMTEQHIQLYKRLAQNP